MNSSLSLFSSWHTLAKPRTFLKISTKVLPFSFFLSALLFTIGLYVGLLASPADYQQGELVRIMYVHVPAAWMSLLLYIFLALMSFITLVWRSPLPYILAQSLAPVGGLLTFLSLSTGALWGKPTWGTFWVWDARLTSAFLLFLTYLSYGAIHTLWGPRKASLFALCGLVNIPIIKGSVVWWSTLHQPGVFSNILSSSLHPSMLRPLIIMAFAYFFFSLGIVLLRTQTRLHHLKKRAF